MPSIIYWLPGSPHPNGGASVLLEHVEILTKHGLSSFAVAPANFKLWRQTTASIVDGSGYWSYPRGSIFILPETTGEADFSKFGNATNLTRVVFCQSYRGIEPSIKVFRNLDKYGIAGVFSNAPLVSTALTKAAGIADAPVVSCSIDTGLFNPAPKRLAVAYMPSKLPEAQAKIAAMLGSFANEIEWIKLIGATREQIAESLSQSAVFLALGFREGFGLPPLEAMASGCLVVGFHAQGAKAYADSMNGFWHEEDDYSGVADSLKTAIGLAKKKGDAYHRRVSAGISTANRYAPVRTERELMGYITTLIVSRGQKISDFIA